MFSQAAWSLFSGCLNRLPIYQGWQKRGVCNINALHSRDIFSVSVSFFFILRLMFQLYWKWGNKIRVAFFFFSKLDFHFWFLLKSSWVVSQKKKKCTSEINENLQCSYSFETEEAVLAVVLGGTVLLNVGHLGAAKLRIGTRDMLTYTCT